MIKHLHIKNFAIIDELDIELRPGLTVITGETGSGKTIIMDALSFSLGGKSDKILVRNGTKRAVVETELNNKNFRRILFANGRSKSFYNDEPVPLITIKKNTFIYIIFRIVLSFLNNVFILKKISSIFLPMFYYKKTEYHAS